MIETHGHTVIDLPIEACWEKMRDYSLAHNYVPDVMDTQIISDAKEGLGAHRQVHMKDQVEPLDETIIDWQEGRGFTLRLHKGDGRAIPIFKEFHFSYHIEADGEDATVFSPSIKVAPRFGFNLLTRLLIKKQFTKTLTVIGQSMKEYYETGTPTSHERRKAIRKSF